ncbi:hypothetical protein llap_7679 [Limosa lapponica baueri]|uniref:Uncharacterized protein n=1 Tax=Limosa lapponica baueri TaxID=1758121 RepID=A0A2I0U7N2_LIMLA|nr:hypothetical protein llap_7679 [Limosa lapponica baueri]
MGPDGIHPQVQSELTNIIARSLSYLWKAMVTQDHDVLILGAPELDAVLQMESHQSGVEGENHLPQPAGHASFDTTQDAVGLLGCECTLSTHVELLIPQQLQILLGRAFLNPFSPQPVFLPGVALTQVQDLASALLSLSRFTQGHFLSLSRSRWMSSHPTGMSTTPLSLVSSANLLRVNSNSPCNKDAKQHRSQYRPLRNATRHCSRLGR